MSGERRPADYQVFKIYRCEGCGSRVEVESCYSAGNCGCGGELKEVGESFPADSEDWDEERGSNGEWRNNRDW